MIRSTLSPRILLLLMATALVALPAAGWAKSKEESKIQIRLTDGNGNGNGNGLGGGDARADVRSHLQGSKVDLRLRARGLDPDTEYVLLCKEDENDPESAELVRFTTGGNGSANVTQNLSKTDDPAAPADPRGKFLVLADGADSSVELLGGWLYGEPADDGPMTKIKETTQLRPDEDSAPAGGVEARYDRRPNGNGTLSISMRRVPAGDYEVLVDGVFAAALTPNPGGSAKADFQTKPLKGNSGKAKPHKKKKELNFDPRRKEILVQLDDGTPMFSGPMIAQIKNLNYCAETSDVSPLTGPVGSGSAALEIEDDCETAFDVEVMDVPAAFYDLYVDGMLVATFEAEDDVGTVFGFVRFDPTPDEPDELLLDFPVGSSSLVEVFDTGADPTLVDPVLSGTLL